MIPINNYDNKSKCASVNLKSRRKILKNSIKAVFII